MLKVISLAFVILIAGSIGSVEACSVPWIRWTKHAQGTMTVQSGKPCKIYFHSLGPTHEARIIKRPLHGSINWDEVWTLTYRSRPGYVGGDRFIYERAGRNSRNRPLRVKIEILVTVTP